MCFQWVLNNAGASFTKIDTCSVCQAEFIEATVSCLRSADRGLRFRPIGIGQLNHRMAYSYLICNCAG